MRAADLPLTEVIGLAAAFAASGLVTLAFIFAGEGTYVALADPRGAVLRGEGTTHLVDVATLVGLHDQTLGYVLGESLRLPDAPGTSEPLFSAEERSHLADVRSVFTGARIAGTVGFVVIAFRLFARRSSSRRVLARAWRRAATLAAVGVAAVAAAAALAFEPLFLAFHRVFFPQGNFLFDPARSNLLAMYPEAYWMGVTLRIGIAFVALAATVAVGATLVARRP